MLKNNLKLNSGLLVKIVAQFFYFMIIARLLGASEYGIYVSISAACALILPLIGLGQITGFIDFFTKNGNSRRSGDFLSTALIIIIVTGLFFGCFLLLYSIFFLDTDLSLFYIFLLIISEIILSRAVDLYASFGQSSGNFSYYSILQLLPPVIRLAFLLVLGFLFDEITLETWSIFNFISISLVFLYAFANSSIKIGSPKRSLFNKKYITFANSQLLQSAYENSDKIFLSHSVSSEVLGTYNAVYKMYEVFFVPSRSFLSILFPKIIATNEAKDIMDLIVINLKKILTISIASALVFMIAAPLLDRLLGDSFLSAIGIILCFSCILPLRSMCVLLLDGITGFGDNKTRLLIQISGLLVSVTSNTVFIALYGALGAALSMGLSYVTMIIISMLIMVKKSQLNGKIL